MNFIYVGKRYNIVEVKSFFFHSGYMFLLYVQNYFKIMNFLKIINLLKCTSILKFSLVQ